MGVRESTRDYETWLARTVPVVRADFDLKHQLMAVDALAFLRATFYRWAQLWPETCGEFGDAPAVLAVGDLHVENFGTWRDIEGRLVWGINDFDEAAELPYTLDLIRLATSALVASDEGHLGLKAKDACAAIVEGYRKSLAEHGQPFVLEEKNTWLGQIATNELRDPVHFWDKMNSLPKVTEMISASAREALEHLLPERKLDYRIVRRIAGLGSLGHIRLVAIAECHGSKVAREAKALAGSSVYWARGDDGSPDILYQAIISQAVRCPDPFVRLHGHWIVRRLSPHCSRIELSLLPKDRDELRLLFAMGWETANIHLGSRKATRQIRHHFDRLKPNWLSSAAKDMAGAVREDWLAWGKSWNPSAS
jgi:hypothetical protein